MLTKEEIEEEKEIRRQVEAYVYDESILKRRMIKLMGNGISLSVPKKSLTAYAILVKSKRREQQKQNSENVKRPDMMKDLGKMWSSLSRKDKAIFEEFAKRDKRRYDSEMKEFTERGGDAVKLIEVEAKRPKKCLSAYMIFVRETRSKI